MNPFDRLKPYQVAHSLIHRLARYEASEVPSLFRHVSWETLVYWEQLMEEALSDTDPAVGHLGERMRLALLIFGALALIAYLFVLGATRKKDRPYDPDRFWRG